MYKIIQKFTSGVEKFQIVLGCATFTMFLIAAVCQVTSRLIKVPMVWTEDVANYSFIWSVFMGGSVILLRKQHFKFTFVETKLKKAPKELYNVAIYGLILAFCVLITVYGVQLVTSFWNYRWNSLPALRMGYHWLCVPIMGFCMSVYSIQHIVTALENIRTKNFTEFDLLKSIEETENVEIRAEGGVK